MVSVHISMMLCKCKDMAAWGSGNFLLVINHLHSVLQVSAVCRDASSADCSGSTQYLLDLATFVYLSVRELQTWKYIVK